MIHSLLILLVLSGGLTAAEPTDYGRELPIRKNLGVGPTMDAAVEANRLYAVGRGRLVVADITVPEAPKLIGRIAGLGQVRQIAVRDGLAYVTAREDGLFVVDVRDPSRLAILAHYDTIELATGIALSGDVALVACRTCGVELVDIRTPRRPRHLSTVRTGEAQSITARDGYLYVGVWATRELVICDIRDPLRPRVIARAPMDGYGDGVCVVGRYCYAATGHHSGKLRRNSPDDQGFGRGHGLEIFDVADPARPVWVSRLKLPVFYRIGMDMWSVKIAGRHAFVADTFNGVFVIDVADPRHPRCVAHRRIAVGPRAETPGPVAGLALAAGCIYAAGAFTDLHVIAAAGLADKAVHEDRHPLTLAPGRQASAPAAGCIYQPDGQVHAVAVAERSILVAAGSAGLHVIADSPPYQLLAQYPTQGCCSYVAVQGDRLYVAEGLGGMSIWQHQGDVRWKRLGTYRPADLAVRQVVVPPPGRFALLHVGPDRLEILDVSDAEKPTRVLSESRLGLFYTYPIAEGLLEGRYACCHWHATGLFWYDLGGDRPRLADRQYTLRIGSQNGVAMLPGKALVTTARKYVLIDPRDPRPVEQLPRFGVPGRQLEGKPSVFGTRLYVSNRYSGEVAAADIADAEHPRWLGATTLREHPGLVVEHRAAALIPGGYDGVIRWQP